MVYSLLVITCLSGGGDCAPTILSDQFTSSNQCVMASQTMVAEFMRDRPKRVVERIICADARRVGFYLGREWV